MQTLQMRKKAWERSTERGFCTRVARRLGAHPSTVRRWLLPPDHKDRRSIRDARVEAWLARLFDLQPADFVWLHGERAARRKQAMITSTHAVAA